MPPIARRYNNRGPIVFARDVKVTDKDNEYYCATIGCRAKMSIVKVGNIDEAFFRRLSSSPNHISSNCFRCGLVFDKTKYEETLFQKDLAFDWLYEKAIQRPQCPTGKNTNTVGGNIQRIRTLKQIYEMCVTRTKNDRYNGVMINDIFADEENFAVYKGALVNDLIVECSYYKKAFNETALIMNYPTDFRKPHIHIKLNFADKKMFWYYYEQFKDLDHFEPIVIAGNWKPVVGNLEAQFECEIISSRQLHIVK